MWRPASNPTGGDPPKSIKRRSFTLFALRSWASRSLNKTKKTSALKKTFFFVHQLWGLWGLHWHFPPIFRRPAAARRSWARSSPSAVPMRRPFSARHRCSKTSVTWWDANHVANAKYFEIKGKWWKTNHTWIRSERFSYCSIYLCVICLYIYIFIWCIYI